MQNIVQLNDDIYWVGGSDRRISLFENAFPVPEGMCYNSYIIMDEKTALIDTVDKSIGEQFFENIEYLLEGRNLDYLVINHMEPDHCATLGDLLLRYPNIKIISNEKQKGMIANYFSFHIEDNIQLVKENDILDLGKHKLTFLFAPMVHWPEVMVTYDKVDQVLFSADAFGIFGAMNGNVIAQMDKFESEWIPRARRYYSNIVGKYGLPVQKLLGKVQALEISMICPLHGLVITDNIPLYVSKYETWSQYIPEDQGVMIVYASIYGHTQNAAEILASKLAQKGVRDISIFDVSSVDTSYIISEVFRCSHLVFASITYNGGIFSKMENLLNEIKAHGVQNRIIGLIENGSWAATAGGKMAENINQMKKITILEEEVSIRSSLKKDQIQEIDNLACAIMKTFHTIK